LNVIAVSKCSANNHILDRKFVIWFTGGEGFDARDLREAKVLLEELAV
jgi:hypothetical protein